VKFSTDIDIQAAESKIDHSDSILFIGSCFADNIGQRLEQLKFNVIHNPFGVLYNPVSVKDNLEILIEKRYFNENDLYLYNNRWISFSHYSVYSDSDKQEALRRINNSIGQASEMLKAAKLLCITFGTSWVYEFKETGKIVANCHKIPQVRFNRYLLDIPGIVDLYSELLKKLHRLNPALKIVFTVSPIRHWKDGAANNQLSKSILIVSVHSLLEKFTHTSYFPAYEIVMDELRDYRYYADDMLHPSDLAISYIWEKFSEMYFSDDTKKIIRDIEPVIKAMNHRPSDPKSKDHRKFMQNILTKIMALEHKYPFLDFTPENNYFQGKQ